MRATVGAASRIGVAGLGCLSLLALAASASSAELQPRTDQAFERYADEAQQAFLQRTFDGLEQTRKKSPGIRLVHTPPDIPPSANGRIVKVPGGVIHHWRGTAFIPDVGLDQVLALAQAYDDYTRVHPRLISARLLARDGATFRLVTRVREDAGAVSAVLDIWSVVEYERGEGYAHALGRAEDIRQVKNAAQPDETHMPAGRDSGYLWRARTFTRFVERDGGVQVELETLGLSRSFPPLLRWIIEPIARRLGRSSIERSLGELKSAVLRTR